MLLLRACLVVLALMAAVPPPALAQEISGARRVFDRAIGLPDSSWSELIAASLELETMAQKSPGQAELLVLQARLKHRMRRPDWASDMSRAVELQNAARDTAGAERTSTGSRH